MKGLESVSEMMLIQTCIHFLVSSQLARTRDNFAKMSYTTRTTSYRCRATRRLSRKYRTDIVDKSSKLAENSSYVGRDFDMARSCYKWRDVYDMCTGMRESHTTSFRHVQENKIQARILNGLKFSPHLGEYWRQRETSVRHSAT